MTELTENKQIYIFAKGEMADRTRSFDWQNTPLGPISTWSASLLSIVNQILDSSFPMFIWWGAEKTQFYNDAYLEILGTDPSSKHPKALGQRGEECWPEIWNVINPLLEEVLFSAKPIYLEDQLIPIYRKGLLDKVYWTFSYNIIRDVKGAAAGILVVCSETTQKVVYQKELAVNHQTQQNLIQELAASNQELEQARQSLLNMNVLLEQKVEERTYELLESNAQIAGVNNQLLQTQQRLQDTVVQVEESNVRFQNLIREATVGIIVFTGDDMIVEIVNQAYATLVGSTTQELLGQPIYEYIPTIKAHLKPIADQVRESGESVNQYDIAYSLTREGEHISGYLNVIYQPYREADGKYTGVMMLCQDTTEQVNARLQVQKADEMTNLAISAARLGYWHIDPANKALIYNDTLAELYGYEGTEKMTFEQAIDQITPNYRVMVVEEINHAIADGGHYDVTFTQKRFNDGAIIWLHSLGRISRDKQGNPSVFSGFVMDVTELKRDEQRKNDFIGMVSHELKTPVTSLLAYLQILQQKSLKADDQFASAAIANCLKQVKKMTIMINSFLNVSRLDAGKILIKKARFNMAELMMDIEAEAQSMISSHTILFAPVEETFLNADRDKVEQVINNLISNALKYSYINSTINIACVHKDQQILVSVQDEGPGISPENAEKIFERYYRTETAAESLVAGFGIGLYLCAEIIHQHGGNIWVDPGLGAGATFHFSLPLQ